MLAESTVAPRRPRFMKAPPPHPYGWYAPLKAEEVRGNRPTSFEFMGQELVAFRDRGGGVQVLHATCPHFGAHLGHGGKVLDGCLRCPYHHLDFDGEGNCVRAPRHYASARVQHLRTGKWACAERYGMIWVWHGPTPSRPERPLPLEGLEWEGWTAPITNEGLSVPGLHPLWLAENIADVAHLITVHCWDLQEVVIPPGAQEDGSFRIAVEVLWRLGARSGDPRLQALGHLVKSAFHLDVRALDAGIVVAEATLKPEQGSMRLRTIVLVLPRAEGGCQLRVLVTVKKMEQSLLSRGLRRCFGVGIEELVAPLFLRIGVADFQSDAKVWERRKHLEAPIPLSGEGAFIEYRRWSQQFWPEEWGRN